MRLVLWNLSICKFKILKFEIEYRQTQNFKIFNSKIRKLKNPNLEITKETYKNCHHFRVTDWCLIGFFENICQLSKSRKFRKFYRILFQLFCKGIWQKQSNKNYRRLRWNLDTYLRACLSRSSTFHQFDAARATFLAIAFFSANFYCSVMKL